MSADEERMGPRGSITTGPLIVPISTRGGRGAGPVAWIPPGSGLEVPLRYWTTRLTPGRPQTDPGPQQSQPITQGPVPPPGTCRAPRKLPLVADAK
uniref:Uncharacterized protein n=1 Tax=Knipowitschia caucasica TaxID=637954 RepID=A0AAV2K1V6_KNICA